jgi:hypothetical protein
MRCVWEGIELKHWSRKVPPCVGRTLEFWCLSPLPLPSVSSVVIFFPGPSIEDLPQRTQRNHKGHRGVEPFPFVYSVSPLYPLWLSSIMNTSISEQVLFWLFLFLGHRGPSHTLMNVPLHKCKRFTTKNTKGSQRTQRCWAVPLSALCVSPVSSVVNLYHDYRITRAWLHRRTTTQHLHRSRAR